MARNKMASDWKNEQNFQLQLQCASMLQSIQPATSFHGNVSVHKYLCIKPTYQKTDQESLSMDMCFSLPEVPKFHELQ